MNWYGANTSDQFGVTFFKRSLSQSAQFLAGSALSLAVIFFSVWFFLVYRTRLSPGMVCLLFIAIPLRVLSSVSAAIMRHKSLCNVQRAPELSVGLSESSANAALGVAARAILDDLFYTSLILLVFLFVASRLLRHLF